MGRILYRRGNTSSPAAMRIILLTGDQCSGKSAFMSVLATRGNVFIIDYDALIRETVLRPEAILYQETIKKFGPGVVDRRYGWIDETIASRCLLADRAYRQRVQRQLLWESAKKLVRAFLQLERVVAVEMPMSVSSPAWFPKLPLLDRLRFWNWWHNPRTTQPRLCWMFLELSRAYPVAIWTLCLGMSLSIMYLSIKLAGLTTLLLIAVALNGLIRYFQKKAGMLTVRAVLCSAFVLLLLGLALRSTLHTVSDSIVHLGVGAVQTLAEWPAMRQFCIVTGVLAGTIPLFACALLNSTTVVCTHAKRLEQTYRLQKKLQFDDKDDAVKALQTTWEDNPGASVEYFCKNFADYVVSFVGEKSKRTLENDADGLLKMIKKGPPYYRVLGAVAGVVVVWLAYKHLGLMWQVVGLMFAIVPFLRMM